MMTKKQLRQRQEKSKTLESTDAFKKERDKKKNKYAAAHDELQRATSSFTHRLWTRAVIVASVIIIVYFYTKKQTNETKFAKVRENLPLRMQKFKCSEEYEKEIQQFPQCVPKKCGRLVTDDVIEPAETDLLLHLASKIIDLAGSSGGASILDIDTGALSYGDIFLNVFQMPNVMQMIKSGHLTVYNSIKKKIKLAIAEQFGIQPEFLYLTKPTFFSRITNATAKTVHDEYWHEHVDKETYPSFHYTSLLYLTTFNKDFKGGKFIFVDGKEENRTISTIEPKKGRVIAFTSGFENRHHVEKVTEGTRFAITISFTCNKKDSIKEPKLASL